MVEQILPFYELKHFLRSFSDLKKAFLPKYFSLSHSLQPNKLVCLAQAIFNACQLLRNKSLANKDKHGDCKHSSLIFLLKR